jgi:hypothetical protein
MAASPLGSVEFTTLNYSDGYAFSTTFTEELQVAIANADAVQFGGDLAGKTFHVTGLAEAWTAVQRCAQR